MRYPPMARPAMKVDKTAVTARWEPPNMRVSDRTQTTW